jgi:hypothetical protein
MSEASSMLRTTRIPRIMRDIRLSSVQAVRTDSPLHIVCAMESAHRRASASVQVTGKRREEPELELAFDAHCPSRAGTTSNGYKQISQSHRCLEPCTHADCELESRTRVGGTEKSPAVVACTVAAAATGRGLMQRQSEKTDKNEAPTISIPPTSAEELTDRRCNG